MGPCKSSGVMLSFAGRVFTFIPLMKRLLAAFAGAVTCHASCWVRLMPEQAPDAKQHFPLTQLVQTQHFHLG